MPIRFLIMVILAISIVSCKGIDHEKEFTSVRWKQSTSEHRVIKLPVKIDNTNLCLVKVERVVDDVKFQVVTHCDQPIYIGEKRLVQFISYQINSMGMNRRIITFIRKPKTP